MPHRSALLLVFLTAALPARAQIFGPLSGGPLRVALVETYAPVTVLSSAASKDILYSVIDSVTVDGTLGTAGLYTGYFVPFDCNPSCDPSQDVFNNEAGLNQEHTWPRSEGAGSGLAERDMHHLFPTKVNVNSARASLPFGEIDDAQTTAWYRLDQSRSTPPPEDERDAWSELRADVRFEPREEKKGDVARALFYFYTMYGPDGSGQAHTPFFEEMKETLLAWHEADPATPAEEFRSYEVARYQSTGQPDIDAINPFVHDSTLARRAFFSDPAIFVQQDDAADCDTRLGISWATAFCALDQALDFARAYEFVEDVWIAQGTYRPGNSGGSPDPREATFRLRRGLALYGGFAGDEERLEERDWETNETVLSGDLGVLDDDRDNAYHVVTAEDLNVTTILDGLTIQSGRPDGDGDSDAAKASGGGLYALDSRIVLRNDRITDHSAGNNIRGKGAGIYVERSTVEMENVVVSDNIASSGSGGLGAGMHVCCFSEVRISDSAFLDNRANGPGLVQGGGLYVHNSSARLDGVRFESNRIAAMLQASGGGMHCGEDSECVVVDSDFVRNRAENSAHGGGLSIGPSGVATVVNSVFYGNEAVAGGALSTAGSLRLTNALMVGNKTIPQSQGKPDINGGSGIVVFDGSAILTHVTLTSNIEGVLPRKGAIRLTEDADVLIGRNAILWGNGPVGIQTEGASLAAFDRAIVEGDFEGTGVLDADPLFVDAPSPGSDGIWGTQDDHYGDVRLRKGSPGVDYGRSALLPEDSSDLDGDGDTDEPLPLDLNGTLRVQGNAPDLGAYETGFAVASEPSATLPQSDRFYPAYPNPARTRTTFTLELAYARDIVRVEAFDVLGRRVAVLQDGPLAAGRHALSFNANALPAGTYLVRSTADDFQQEHRVTLIR